MGRLALNPFLYGKPVPTGRFFGRQEQVRTLFSRLYNGESTAIVGEPHIGKTSLLNYIADEDTRREWIAQAFAKHVFVDFDCHLMSADFKSSDFWQQIVGRIIESAPGDDVLRQCEVCSQNNYGSFTLERMFRLLARREWRAVLLIDEFDTLLNHPNFKQAEFLGALRSLATRTDGLVVITASRLSVAKMNRLSLDNNPYGSPFFNNFIEVRLLPLGLAEAQQLIETTLQKAGGAVAFSADDCAFLYALAGRHPFLLQIAAASLYDMLAQAPLLADPRERAMQVFQQRAEAHFDDFWRSLELSDQRALLVLSLAEHASRIAGRVYDVQELGTFDWYDSDIRRLSELGIVELHLVQMGDARWSVCIGGLTHWLLDNVIAGARYAEDFAAWLHNQQHEGLLTREEVRMLASVQEKFLTPNEHAAGSVDLTRLRLNLVEYFDPADLEIFCADMGIDYGGLAGEGKEQKVFKLIEYCRQNSRIAELVEGCQKARPNVAW